MKERKIKIIISVMTLAVIGLLFIQIYWINSLIKLEEAKFAGNVNDVLLSVTKKIEKKETANLITKNFLVKRVNSKGEIITIEKKGPPLVKDKNPDVIWHEEAKDKFIIKTNGDSSKVFSVSPSGNKNNIKLFAEKIKLQRKIDTLIDNKGNVIQEIFEELIVLSDTASLTKRLPPKMLDSLLQSEFKNKGITAGYYFGITGNKKSVYEYISSVSKKTELTNSPFKVKLFPNNVFENSHYLTVFFPQQGIILFKNVFPILALSVFLILTITFVFFKTIQIFLKQKKVSELKNDLINNITHELKTPITSISLAAQNLKTKHKNDKTILKYTHIIKEESDRLSNIVENVLSTASLEKGNYQFKSDRINIHELIKTAVKQFNGITADCNGKIEIKPYAVKDIITGDAFHISNAVKNIIDNSIKYCTKKPMIEITTADKDNFISIIITDNGIGIDKKYMDKIFDTFYRVPTGNLHNIKGNGIGLSYTKQVIEAHHGKISATSRLNKGSRFEILLPVI